MGDDPSTAGSRKEQSTDAGESRKPRRLGPDGLKLTSQLTRQEVLKAWGEPDAVDGSGFEYLVYRLDDGNSVFFLFSLQSPPSLARAILKSGTGGEDKLLLDATAENRNEDQGRAPK